MAVIFSQVATQLRRVLELRLRSTEIEYCSNTYIVFIVEYIIVMGWCIDIK